jgi:2,5-diamino-6-(ribosylamino)-4(3H)-pyrimidinone 5'-phosphate reductase
MEKPYVIICSAMSLDGKIASKTGYSKLSCPHDLRQLYQLRAEVDAVMVGANTVIKDDPKLTAKLVEHKNPLRIIVDGRCRSPLNSLVFTDGKAPTLLATTRKAPPKKLDQLKRRGVEVLVLGDKLVDLRELMKQLSHRGVKRLLVEGGGTLNWFMLSQGLVDELRVTVTPYLVGGVEAVTLVEGEGLEEKFMKLKLVSVDVCKCGNEVLLRYEGISSTSS